MYADTRWTIRGLRESLTRRSVAWSPDMKKHQLIELYNRAEFDREQSVFHKHMEWVAKRQPVTV